MAFIPAPNMTEVQFRTTYGGEPTMNRIHVNCFAAPTLAMCQSIANLCHTWWTGNVTAITPPTLSLREVFVKDISVANGFQATSGAGSPVPGTVASVQLPNNVTICASIRSGLTGRSARGRWYWQGLTEAQVTDNTVVGGTLTSIDAALTNLGSALGTAGFAWQIVSFITNGAPRPGGPVYFTVADIVFVDAIVDSMRNRLPNH